MRKHRLMKKWRYIYREDLVESEMNDLGRDGWEMVGIAISTGNISRYIFKQEIFAESFKADVGGMKTATFVRYIDGFVGEARLYRLSQPIEYDDDGTKKKTEFVIVCASNLMFNGRYAVFNGPKTYILPADVSGKVIGHGTIIVSENNCMDPAIALANLGFQICQKTESPCSGAKP